MREKKRYFGECQVCGNEFYEKDLGDGVWYNYDEPVYEYRGFMSCEDCYDELIVKVEGKRKRIIDEFDSRSLKTQRVELVPPHDASGTEHPLYKASQELTKRQREVASNPNWEEENEYRKGKL